MAEYVTLTVETDPDELSQEALDYLASVIPGFNANIGNLETWLIDACARIGAEVRDVASDVPAAIFRYFGATIAGLPPIDAIAATGASTWVVVDNAGYTIEAGTLVAIAAAGDTLIPFEVVDDVVIAPGGNTTGTGEVLLLAVEPGADGTALTANPTLIDPLDFVDSITLVGSTASGLDAESDDDYLNRLRSELQLLTPRPIIPKDFAVLARRVSGVRRALAIDGLIPPSSTGNERAVAVAVQDADGNACSSGVKTAVDDLLQASREVNFIVNVIDPTYTSVDVSFTATLEASSEFDAATVQAAAIQALTDFLNPANWGEPKFGDQRDWIDTPVVRYLEVAEVINNVDGVHHIVTLTVDGGVVDVALSGFAPLTTAGTITGTVT